MKHIHYDDHTGKLKGFYTQGDSINIPSPTVVVSNEIKVEVEKSPHMYEVVGRQLRRKAKKEIPELPPRKPVSEFTYDDRIYVVDKLLLNNLSLNLSICIHDSEHECKIWCKVSGKFELTLHNKDTLLGVAKAYESARHV